jgi:hypothetical protein
LDLKIIWNSAFVIIIENEEYRKIVEDTEEHISEPTFENDGYLYISFALLYSLLQKRLLTCTLLKLCLTQVLFNKRRMQCGAPSKEWFT